MARAIKAEKSLSRSSRDAEATQAIILAAAEEEFAKHGFTAARTEVIAAKTGVAKSMIYYYFKDKQGLYQAVLERSHADLLQISQQLDLDQLPPEAALNKFLTALLDCVSRNPKLPTIMFHEAIQNQGNYYRQGSSPDIDQTLIRILDRGIAVGAFRQLDPFQTAINIMGACLFYFMGAGNIQQHLQGKQPLSKPMLEKHNQEAIALILAGVRKLQEG